MDQAGMRKILGKLALGGACLLGLWACEHTPPANKPKSTPTPPPPVPAEAVRIDKPANVSFSTYSKEWPVGWTWIDPDEKNNPTPHDVNAGVLRVIVPTGKDIYGSNRTAPRYLKAITGDFQIETRVRFKPTENYQGAGLLIYVDENNFLRFEHGFGGIGGGGGGLRLDVQQGDRFEAITTTNDVQTDLAEVDLRLVRIGGTFTTYWRADEDAAWRDAGEYVSTYPETILAGLVACNTAREVTVEFAYIKLLPAPKPTAKP